MRLASIDLGSNTLRMLVAEVEDGRIVKVVLNLGEITRISEGLRERGSLSPEAKERTLAVLRDYAERAGDAGAEGISAIATEALRKASDAEDFLKTVREETGLDLEIISGQEEARRTLLGIRAGMGHLNIEGPKLLIDIGGGSVELVYTEDWRHYKALSLPVGAVTLYERFIMNDPPLDTEMENLTAFCYNAFLPLRDFIPDKERPPILVGTAGTITTLAAVDMAMDEYDPDRVTGYRLDRETVDRLLVRFVGLSEENRKLIAGLEPGREDVIVTGTAVLGAIMDAVKAGSILVCDYGLREGNLLDFFIKKGF